MNKHESQGDIQTPIEEDEIQDQHVCPNCQLPKDEWSDVQGFELENVLYCCEGCAENTGCTCMQDDEEDLENPTDATVEDTARPNRDADI